MSRLERWLSSHERTVLYALLVAGLVRLFVITVAMVLVAQWVVERLR